MQEHPQPVQPFIIRPALPHELDAVGEVIRAAYQQYEADYPADSWPRWIQMIGEITEHAGRAEILAVEQAGRIVGTVTYYADASLSGQGDWPPGSAGMVRLAVLPEGRGQGIGRALAEECIRRAREAGLQAIALHTVEWMSVARAMYERMGFVRVPEIDFHTRTGVVGLGYVLELK